MKVLSRPLIPHFSFTVVLLTLCSAGTGVYAGTTARVTDRDGVPPVSLVKDSIPPADDTGRNVRDRDGQTLTPMDHPMILET